MIYRSKWRPPFSPVEKGREEGEDKRKLRGSKDSFLPIRFDWLEGRVKFYAKSFVLKALEQLEVQKEKWIFTMIITRFFNALKFLHVPLHVRLEVT